MTLSEKIQIPLFPLSIFLLPGERTHLHIFEPRYRQLFSELETGEALFGIPYVSGKGKKKIGARCRLVHISRKYNTGEFDVLVECEGLFILEEFQETREGKLYPFGKVTLLRDVNQETVSKQVMDAYDKLCEALKGTDLPIETCDTRFTMAMLASLNCSSEEKYRFASLTAEGRDSSLLSTILMLTQMVLQEKAQENGILLN